ncbi:MAG: NAD(P)-dependent oxidoreductase [Thermoplasmata archaeon]|nr:NAD(P)-dependent oxidoreductase [Thermoplasmata archaeon]
MTDASNLSATTAPAPSAALTGFVGLGQMGQPIAARLLASGVPLAVTSRTRARSEPLVASGAHWCESPAEVASKVGAGVVFVMVPESKDTRKVLTGRRGLLKRAQPGLLVVDLSTVSPEECRATAALLNERQVAYADCPVGGSVDAAEAGRLLVFAGGSDADLDRAQPLLLRFAQGVERMGPVGMGEATKLANNLLTLGHVALIGEALAFGEALGLDRRRLLTALAGGGGRSAMLEAKREMIERGEYAPKFRLSLALKDAKLIEKAARVANRPLLLAPPIRKAYDRASKEGRGAEDFAAVVESVRRRPVVPSTPSGTELTP